MKLRTANKVLKNCCNGKLTYRRSTMNVASNRVWAKWVVKTVATWNYIQAAHDRMQAMLDADQRFRDEVEEIISQHPPMA